MGAAPALTTWRPSANATAGADTRSWPRFRSRLKNWRRRAKSRRRLSRSCGSEENQIKSRQPHNGAVSERFPPLREVTPETQLEIRSTPVEEMNLYPLDTFEYEYVGNRIEIEFTSSEFTAICPFSDFPDFATLYPLRRTAAA